MKQKLTPRGVHKNYEWHMKIFRFYKAGMTTAEIALALNTTLKIINNSFQFYKEMYMADGISFGRKNESQDENMYFNISPLYNSFQLKGEELEIFNNEPAHKFKFEYVNE